MNNKFYVISIKDTDDPSNPYIRFHGTFTNYISAEHYCNILVNSFNNIYVHILDSNCKSILYKGLNIRLNNNANILIGNNSIDRRINNTDIELTDDEINMHITI